MSTSATFLFPTITLPNTVVLEALVRALAIYLLPYSIIPAINQTVTSQIPDLQMKGPSKQQLATTKSFIKFHKLHAQAHLKSIVHRFGPRPWVCHRLNITCSGETPSEEALAHLGQPHRGLTRWLSSWDQGTRSSLALGIRFWNVALFPPESSFKCIFSNAKICPQHLTDLFSCGHLS